jgi:hypothetical protein
MLEAGLGAVGSNPVDGSIALAQQHCQYFNLGSVLGISVQNIRSSCDQPRPGQTITLLVQTCRPSQLRRGAAGLSSACIDD